MQRIIIGVLVLIIGYLIYRDFRPVPEKPVIVSQSDGKIDSLKGLVASLQAAGDTLRLALEADSIKQAEQALKFKSKISVLTKKLAEKRPDIQPLLDSIPKLAAFVLLQDSIIDVQAVRIDSLEAQKARQWRDFNKLLEVQEEKFQASSEINLHLEAINDNWRDENKRLKRQNRILKVSVGIAFVSGILITN